MFLGTAFSGTVVVIRTTCQKKKRPMGAYELTRVCVCACQREIFIDS